MAVIRVQKNKDYLTMNKTGLCDVRLSWKAKGILAYILSLPDDWQIYVGELVTHARDGSDGTSSGINELIKCGYIIRTRERFSNGRLGDYIYTVFEIPQNQEFQPKQEKPKQEKPKQEKPKQEKPKQEKPILLNTNKTNTNKTNINITNTTTTNKKICSSCSSKLIKEVAEYFNVKEYTVNRFVSEYELTDEWLDFLFLYSQEHKAERFIYLKKCIEVWRKKGLDTIEKVQASIDEFSSKKSTASTSSALATKQKNKFMNFPQRTYNFDEIEKQDLERNLKDAKML